MSAGASLAVKNITMTLPEAVAQGDTVTLRCDYDLEQQNLYSIKWFRDESEFYQFVPKEIPASKVFDVDGVKIKVDVSLTFISVFSVASLGGVHLSVQQRRTWTDFAMQICLHEHFAWVGASCRADSLFPAKQMLSSLRNVIIPG